MKRKFKVSPISPDISPFVGKSEDFSLFGNNYSSDAGLGGEKVTDTLTENLTTVITNHPFLKVGMGNTLVQALLNLTEEKGNFRDTRVSDQIFLEVAKVAARRRDISGREIEKGQALLKLQQFVYGDKKNLFVDLSDIEDKFKNVIFLAFVTTNRLLQGINNQKETFDLIVKKMGIKTEFFKSRKEIIEARKIQIRATKKSSDVSPGNKCRNVKSTTPIKSPIDATCDLEIWAKIYSEFSNRNLKNAIRQIV